MADMLSFSVSEAGKSGEIGEEDHNVRCAVSTKIPVSLEELSPPGTNHRLKGLWTWTCLSTLHTPTLQ